MSLKDLYSKPAPSGGGESSSDEETVTSSTPRVAARPSSSSGTSGTGARGGASSSKTTKLPIQIRTMNGKTYKIDAKTDWNVQRLKAEFEKWHGGNAAMCSLYFKAKKLLDNNTLLSYKIGAGDFVMANYRSVGGFSG